MLIVAGASDKKRVKLLGRMGFAIYFERGGLSHRQKELQREVHHQPPYLGSTRDLIGRNPTVIYQVNGGEESQVGNFTLRGTQMGYDDASIQTASSDAEITAVATRSSTTETKRKAPDQHDC